MTAPRARAVTPYRARPLCLRDGRCVTLRGVVEADAAEIVQAFARMSPQSRYLRFMQHKRELDREALERGVRPLAGEEFVFVATVPAADGIDIVGAARFVRSASNLGAQRSICEFSISVDDAWRGSGLARALLAALMRRARHAGYRSIEGFVLAANAPMLGLAHRLGFSAALLPGEPSVKRVWRSLRPPRRRRFSARRTSP